MWRRIRWRGTEAGTNSSNKVLSGKDSSSGVGGGHGGKALKAVQIVVVK